MKEGTCKACGEKFSADTKKELKQMMKKHKEEHHSKKK